MIRYNPSISDGLNSNQVSYRIKSGACNYQNTVKTKTIGEIIFYHSFTLFNLLNLALAILVLLVGSTKNLLFMGVVICNTLISIIQELRSKYIIDKLSIIKESKANVKRDGISKTINMEEVVLDDSIKFDLMAGAFAGGNADYVTLFEPTASMTEAQGKGYIVASVGETSGDIPYTAYFAKKSYIEKNKDIIQSFTDAIYKGQQYVQTHTSMEIAELIKGFFPDTEVDMLANAIESYRQIDAWNTTPFMSEKDFNLLQDIIYDAGELEKYAPYSEVVNNFYK